MEVSKDSCEDSKCMKDSPSSSKDLSKTLPEEAFNNFIQGKRHMLVQDYTFAVQSLGTACELYVKHFGELALECGEVYFLYGKALFRLSQQQAGVLGGALNEGSNDEEDEEKSSGEESKGNDSEKNNSDTEGGDETQEETGNDNQEAEGGEENKDTAKADDEEKETSEPTDSPEAVLDDGSADTKEKETEADTSVQQDATLEENPQEEDDLELAWNTLETAKSIFKRQNDPESQLKVAEILQLLAEISMESDNNLAAINDLKECLSIQEKHLSPDNRILAETYYQMGLAQMLDKQYTEALGNFRTTMKILELRIKNLKNQPAPDSIGSFEAADQAMEIADLESILLDIKEKIEDTEELIRNTKKELEEVFTKGAKVVSSVSESVGESSSKPISNITHLLKRKKPEDIDNEGESKRIKISSSVPNGESDVKE